MINTNGSKNTENQRARLKKIKGIILSIVNAAVEGNLSVIDTADLGHTTKWKIAFLYQKKTDIKISCIYLEDRLRAYAGLCNEFSVKSQRVPVRGGT